MSSATAWARQAGCPVLRSDSFRRGIEDLKLIRQMFAAGRGRLLDEEGIDWWDLLSLLVAQEAETGLVLRRVAAEINPGAELWTTRPGGPAGVLANAVGRPVQAFSSSPLARMARGVRHYATFLRRFPAGQMKEIFLDKYDSDYQWRARFAPGQPKSKVPVLLIPSAYGNVSRAALSYAALLPEQPVLLVATRRSAKQFELRSNVRVHDLASYAKPRRPLREIAAIQDTWNRLQPELCSDPEFEALSRAGMFELFPKWLHDGLHARNAWREVLDREPVGGVLCGDDSNIFTRLPVLLAVTRRIPTVDFHHGALDGRYLLKGLPCDIYLAKNEMERDYLIRICGLPSERVTLGAPPLHGSQPSQVAGRGRTSVVFFSEPYENAGMRVEEVYRELLPPICRLARESGRDVILKLHPFESASERTRAIRRISTPQDSAIITVRDGPLSANLLSQAWFGITIESTTVIDCAVAGIPCFLCGWMTLSPYGYVPQYMRFGVGEILGDVSQVAGIPRRIDAFRDVPSRAQSLWKAADPASMRQWFAVTAPSPTGARSSS